MKDDRPKIIDLGDRAIGLELTPGATLTPEQITELTDELGRRLAMKGVDDAERQTAERMFAEAVGGALNLLAKFGETDAAEPAPGAASAPQ